MSGDGGSFCVDCGQWVPIYTLHACANMFRSTLRSTRRPTPGELRIAAALERIAAALEKLADPPQASVSLSATALTDFAAAVTKLSARGFQRKGIA